MRFSLSALAVLASLFAPVAARANPIFTFTPVGGTSTTFTLDPAAYVFVNVGHLVRYDVPSSTLSFDFWHVPGPAYDLDLVALHNGFAREGYIGPQLYTGLESSPTFILGTYYLNDYYSGLVSATLVIRDTSVTPEPSSFILLGTGVLGVAAAGRRRFSKPSRTLTRG